MPSVPWRPLGARARGHDLVDDEQCAGFPGGVPDDAQEFRVGRHAAAGTQHRLYQDGSGGPAVRVEECAGPLDVVVGADHPLVGDVRRRRPAVEGGQAAVVAAVEHQDPAPAGRGDGRGEREQVGLGP